MSDDPLSRLSRALDRLLLPDPLPCQLAWSADYRTTYIRVPGRTTPHVIHWLRPMPRSEAQILRGEWDGQLVTLYRGDDPRPFQTLAPTDEAA
jgi:hypothetical protein